ncbi:MAG: hypothetical protein R2941_06495 [Desulfobacterales bacterium]
MGKRIQCLWSGMTAHGHVWEWCEDDWHGNYQSAPDEGSMGG